MKHIKIYENIDNDPKIGDYVICNENLSYYDELVNFLSNNVGRIVLKNYTIVNVCFDYLVQYDYIPKELDIYFYNSSNLRPINIDDIIKFSENKEDLEMYINAKKYNL